MVDYGRLDDNFTVLPVTETWYFKAGLRERWHPLGHTVLYGEYLTNNNGNNINLAACSTALFNATQCASYDNHMQVWGLGVVQEIDAAAMSLWLSYRHLSFGDNIGTVIGPTAAGAAGYKDFQYVKFGGLINF